MSAEEVRALALLADVLGARPVSLPPAPALHDKDRKTDEVEDHQHSPQHQREAAVAVAVLVGDERRRDAGQVDGNGRNQPRAHSHRQFSPHTAPLPSAANNDTVLPGLMGRATAPDYNRWLTGTLAAGGCVRPVRLRPALFRPDQHTGELLPVAGDLPDAPDGVIYQACGIGGRRCPPCAERYRQDTWQLIAAGGRRPADRVG